VVLVYAIRCDPLLGAPIALIGRVPSSCDRRRALNQGVQMGRTGILASAA
jgi:hypothetical protein